MVQDLICGLWHTSFTVADLEPSLAFYRDLLGLEVVLSQEQDNAYTRRLVGMADARLRVAQLRVPGAALGPSGHHAGGYVHWGATTQDIMDIVTSVKMTGRLLVAHEAWGPLGLGRRSGCESGSRRR